MVRRNTMNCFEKQLGFSPFTSLLVITISLLLINIKTQGEAFYSIDSPGNQEQQALIDYYLQYIADSISTKNVPLEMAQLEPKNRANVYSSIEGPLEDTPNTYLFPSIKAPRLDLIDAQKLITYLKQLQQQQEISIGDEDNSNSVSDLNSHLPPTDPMANTISGPVNDPADFEAVLSQLTNAINHEVPNSSNRSAILDNLLSVYLGSIMQQLKQQTTDSSDNSVGSTNNNNNNNILTVEDDADASDSSDATTESELTSRGAGSGTLPASRYGGGEYIDHPLALVGHQYVQGGAGEGRQLLGPDGSFENVQVIKSDHAVPTYCDPPNPCPIGYTAEDGCLEKFVNSASFSREYQVKQQCSCDNEHSLFNCASPVSTSKTQIYSIPASHVDDSDTNQLDGDGEVSVHSLDMTSDQEAKQLAANRLDTLARTIQNRFGSLSSVRNLIEKHEEDQAVDEHDTNIVKKGSQIGANFKY